MPCLVHHTRFRSSFHAVVNELRNEKRTSAIVLRSMPGKCCTCKNNELKTESDVLIRSEDKDLAKFESLVDRVNGEKQKDPILISSLHRLAEVIRENRGPPLPPQPKPVKSKKTPDHRLVDLSSDDVNSRSDSSDADGPVPMEISRRSARGKKKPNTDKHKPPKPVKNGVLVFLPYAPAVKNTKKKSDVLTETAKKLRRGRFLGRKSDIKLLEKQHHVRINMIVSSTSDQLKDALKNAMDGLGNLTLYNRKGTPATSPSDTNNQEGEWLLIRSKPKDKKVTEDLEPVLDEIIQRWERTLMVNKRKRDDEE